MEFELSYTLAGFVVGIIVGLTGIGGGAVMTPLLVLGFGISPAVAVGTDLVYAALTKSTGVFVYGRKKLVAWRIVGALLFGSLPGALIALWALNYFALGEFIETAIHITLSIALVLTSLILFFRNYLPRLNNEKNAPPLHQWLIRHRLKITILAGFMLGILVTLSSVGAGALGTALLVMLYPALAIPAIVGTDLAHAVVLASVAGVGHLHLGTVDVSLLVSLLLGSLPGVYLGSHFGSRLPEEIVRPAVAGMLLLVGLRFAF
ncbi:MAG: sulfite exporter TauE/SafE family protein [Pseudomonadota bacterium]